MNVSRELVIGELTSGYGGKGECQEGGRITVPSCRRNQA